MKKINTSNFTNDDIKSNENEVKCIDLRRKIEIKKMTNLMKYEIIYLL
jgi:hypothetical protein